jgi:hypothetical protein
MTGHAEVTVLPTRNPLSLCIFSTALAVLGYGAFRLVELSAHDHFWIRIVLFSLLAMFGAVIALELLWRLFGRTVVLLDPLHLKVRHFMFAFPFEKTYDLTGSSNLRIIELRYKGQRVPWVVFDYDSNVVRLIPGYPEDRARRFIAELTNACPSLRAAA